MNNKQNIDLDNHPNLVDVEPYLQERLKDPEFRQAYEEEGLKIKIAQAVYDKRKVLKMSQAKLAEKAKTTQRMISRIEHANMSVGIDLLQRVFNALGAKISLTIK